jgi:hypothetical protein
LENEKAKPLEEDPGELSDEDWMEVFAKEKDPVRSHESLDSVNQEEETLDPSDGSMNRLGPRKKRLYCRVDIVWPVIYNYLYSVYEAMCRPVSPVLCSSCDDVWLGYEEIQKHILWDPFRTLSALACDQEPSS